MLDQLTKETFEPRRGEVFRLTDEHLPEPLDLTLATVRGNDLRGRADREQFSLHFHGPRDPILPQQIYRLENAELGAMDLFLVPVARDEDGVTYEAVFT